MKILHYFTTTTNLINRIKSYCIQNDIVLTIYSPLTDLNIEGVILLDSVYTITLNEANQNYFLTFNEEFIIISQKYNFDTYLASNLNVFINKKFMKNKMRELKITTPQHEIKKFNTNFETKLSYPLIFKPVDGFKSLGVYKVSNKDHVAEVLNDLAKINMFLFNNNDSYIVEEYISGDEYAIDIIWEESEPIYYIYTYKMYNNGTDFNDRTYIVLDKLTKSEIDYKNHVIKANQKLGVKNGATHTEFIVSNNNAYIIETTLRLGAAGHILEAGELKDNIKYFDIYLDILCNKKATHFSKIIDNNYDYFFYNFPFNNNETINKFFSENIIIISEEINDKLENTNEDSTLAYKRAGTYKIKKLKNKKTFYKNLM